MNSAAPNIPDTTVIPVILSNGSGNRLWPLSRKFYPKQLLMPTNGEHSLLQNTLLRVNHLQDPIVVCNHEHRFMVAEQLLGIKTDNATILIEPVVRNTAPAIAVAALQALKEDENAIIVVCPADHMIGDITLFRLSLETAIEAAKEDCLVTLGVKPSRSETDYGYIKAKMANGGARPVELFVEKPNEQQARKFVESGDYFWNSGIFVFKANVYLKTLEKFNAEILRCCKLAIDNATFDSDYIKLNEKAFKDCPSGSIDYLVMEKTDNLMVVPMKTDWNDLGSWGALWDIAEKDINNNVFTNDVIAINTHNCLSMSYKNKIIALVGLDNLVIIDTKDALLVAKKENVNQVQEVVAQLKALNKPQHLLHKEVYRPWGSYESLEDGDRFQVKHIKVKPGASLSLQLHHHRAEHWIIVKGSAMTVIGNNEKLLSENQSVYIPIGEKHRLTNPGKMTLELIEVQSGAYLEEDDITRFDDIYQRA